MTSDALYDELRALTAAHNSEANCRTCDERWAKVKEVADEIALRAIRMYRGLEDGN